MSTTPAPEFPIVWRKIADLKPNAYNPRRLTEKQRNDIRASIEKFGFLDPVIVNKHPDRLDVIVGGHQRVVVMSDMGRDEVPTVEVSLSESDEKELNIRLNKNQGEWDLDILRKNFDGASLVAWGFESDEIAEAMRRQFAEANEQPVSPVMPIIPKLSEKYDCVTVFAENEIDWAFMVEFFGLQKERSYKTTFIGQSRVIRFARFYERVGQLKRQIELLQQQVNDMAGQSQHPST